MSRYVLNKVLIDGGSGLNIIFASMLKKMGLDFMGLLTKTDIPLYSIVPRKAAMPLGQIILPVMFGTTANYRIEFIKFDVADFDLSYHAIFGPTLAKFVAVPHYPYLLLKMSGLMGILSFRSDLKRSYDCDTEAVQIVAKAQFDLEVQEIAKLAYKMKQDDMESLAKKTISMSTAPDISTKKIVLDDADTSKTTVIDSQLSSE
jgi:hypothetical protein